MAELVLAAINPWRLGVDVGSFLVVVISGAIAGTIAAVAAERRALLPAVVLELVLGIAVGPHVLRGCSQVRPSRFACK